MAEVAERLQAGPAARPLRDSAFDFGDAGAADAGAATRRLPFITTLHGTDITLVGTDRSYFPITKFSIEQSDGITSISENLREQTDEVFGVQNEIRVIHNFVNSEIYQPDAEKRARDGRRRGEALMHLSNFRPVKRVLDCIRILARGAEEAPAHLLMVGDGPDRGPAERLARELGVADACDVSGEAGSCGAADSAGARAADAERDGVVRAGGAGGDGVRRAAGRDARGRRAGTDYARRGRVSGSGGRYRGAGAARGGTADDDALHGRMARRRGGRRSSAFRPS